MSDKPTMFLCSQRLPVGRMPLSLYGSKDIEIMRDPMRPGVISAAYYPVGFSPFEGPSVERGETQIDASSGAVVESLAPGQWWNVALLSLARAEYQAIVWRTHHFAQLGAAVAFGVVGREVVAIVAPLS